MIHSPREGSQVYIIKKIEVDGTTIRENDKGKMFTPLLSVSHQLIERTSVYRFTHRNTLNLGLELVVDN